MSLTEPTGSPQELYEQGMGHYQRREWRQSLLCFRQLKKIEPNWPGIDSLIDEVSWFLQLEEVEARPGQLLMPEVPVPGTGWGTGRWRWLVPAFLVLVLAITLAIWQGWIPILGLGSNLEREALYNRGQSSLAVGDYETARQVFAELDRLSPGDPAAREGLERANRLEALARAYQAAQEAIKEARWSTAEERLADVLAIDPTYGDVAQLVAFVRHQRKASELYRAGVVAYDSGDLSSSIELLESLVELDPTYEQTAVRELLFVLYMSDGEALIAAPDAGMQQTRQAIGRFGKALALRPRNMQAAEESQLANQFLQTQQAMQREDWAQALTLIESLLQQRPDYANGRASVLLEGLLVQTGESAREEGRDSAGAVATGPASASTRQPTPADAPVIQAPAQSGTVVAAASTETLTPVARTEEPPVVVVEADILNVRLGPGTDYPIVGQVSAETELLLVGRNEAGDWLVVCCVDDQPGWVTVRLVRTDSDLSLLPIGLAPTRVPTPTPTATALPTATPTVTPVVTAPPPLPDQPDPTPTPLPTRPPR